MSHTLLIIGASARAAAHSARFAAERPLAVDMFADTDLQACCPAHRVVDYPRGLVSAARQFAPGPWMYTGALENHLDVLSQVRGQRPLLGNSEVSVRQVRDPWYLARELRRHRLLYPPVLRSGDPAVGGDWLWKPYHSAAGQGIWDNDAALGCGEETHQTESAPWIATHYRQRKILGDSIGCVYVAASSRAKLLGATRQLLGCGWAGARGYQYCGSLGPLMLDGSLRRELERVGECLAASSGLVGLFGVDCLVNRQGVWTVEVNPRYTASVEILERALNVPAIALHIGACRNETFPECGHDELNVCWGKAVVYATERLRVGAAFHELARRLNAKERWPLIADIPAVDSEIDPGHPITTVFARGRSVEETEQGLRSRAREVRRTLIPSSSVGRPVGERSHHVRPNGQSPRQP